MKEEKTGHTPGPWLCQLRNRINGPEKKSLDKSRGNVIDL
jgi:hypothetical protein